MQRLNRVTAIILMACFLTLLPGLAGAAYLQLTGNSNTPTVGNNIQEIKTTLVNGKVVETVTARDRQFECYESVFQALGPDDNVVNFITMRPPGFTLPFSPSPMRNVEGITMYGNVPGKGATVSIKALNTTYCYDTEPAQAGGNIRVIINGHDQTILFPNAVLDRAENIATLNIGDGNFCRRTDSGDGLRLRVSNWAGDGDSSTSGTIRFANDEFTLRGNDLIINAPIVCGQGSGNIDNRRFAFAFNSHTGVTGYNDPTARAVYHFVSRSPVGEWFYTKGRQPLQGDWYLAMQNSGTAAGAGNDPVTGSFETNGGLEDIRAEINLSHLPVKFDMVGDAEVLNPKNPQECATIAAQSRNVVNIVPGDGAAECTKGQKWTIRIGRHNFTGLLNTESPVKFRGRSEIVFNLPGPPGQAEGPRCTAQEVAAFNGQWTHYASFMGKCYKFGWVNFDGLTIQFNMPDVPGFN